MYGRASAIVTNLPIVGGILACGVFLILISILGVIGAIKHHQVLLFFVSFVFYIYIYIYVHVCVCARAHVHVCVCDIKTRLLLRVT